MVNQQPQLEWCQPISFILFLDFFHVDHFLKSLLNFLHYRFYFIFFGCKACGILTPPSGIELPVMEGELVLTIRLPGKSPSLFILIERNLVL